MYYYSFLWYNINIERSVIMAVTPDTEIRLVKCNLDLDENNQINFSNATAPKA